MPRDRNWPLNDIACSVNERPAGSCNQISMGSFGIRSKESRSYQYVHKTVSVEARRTRMCALANRGKNRGKDRTVGLIGFGTASTTGTGISEVVRRIGIRHRGCGKTV